MIVVRTPEGSRLVTQADHARLAAEMLRLVLLPELVGHSRRALLLRAAREHDNGWWEADSAPRRDASATTALDFRAFPADIRQEIWRRGVDRFASESPYLAALVATHGLRLLRRVPAQPSWEDFRAELAGRQQELLAAAGESFDSVSRDDLWMALGDSLSLAACTGDPSLVDLPGSRAEVTLPAGDAEGGLLELGLQPFPFAGATSFEVPCRALGRSRFASDSALGVALLSSPWKRLRVRLRPL